MSDMSNVQYSYVSYVNFAIHISASMIKISGSGKYIKKLLLI